MTVFCCVAVGFVAGGGCDEPAPQARPGQIYELHGQKFQVETVAEELVVPWGLDWLPDGTMLVTERPGRLRGYRDGKLLWTAALDQVDHAGEHGLMDLAVSPNFAEDGHVFLAYTTKSGEGALKNVVSRFTLADGKRTDEKIVIDNLPAADYHDGLPLRFGEDGLLYLSTGDATEGDRAQDPANLAGKFLRVRPDGSAPEDNPFVGREGYRPEIWTLGHRNCQGFDWRPSAKNGSGELYAVEHGPSFPIDGVGGKDELNLVVKGRNYGWPKARGSEHPKPFTAPLRAWTPAIAPAGAAFYNGDRCPAWKGRFFFAGLRGASLFCATFDAEQPDRIVDMRRLLEKQFGRLRAVEQGPDGYLYITTSNRDRRGTPADNDDRVLRLVPAE
jgi:glucose/arabinose dehydrogenase